MAACSHLLKKRLLLKYKEMGTNGRIVKTIYGKPLLDVSLPFPFHVAGWKLLHCVFQRIASQRSRCPR